MFFKHFASKNQVASYLASTYYPAGGALAENGRDSFLIKLQARGMKETISSLLKLIFILIKKGVETKKIKYF